MQHTPVHWDIFCKIIDNYGDIGICWRLSRQLAQEHRVKVRLFIDDFNVAKRIIASLQDQGHQGSGKQIIDGVEICNWQQAEYLQPNAVVLETFSCELPDSYLSKMVATKSCWINLEYLSAEAWVADFHARPSQHPTLNITKHFFFPGFEPETGGLIRERNLIKERIAFNADPVLQNMFFENLQCVPDNDEIKLSLFCYAQANILSLIEHLHSLPQQFRIYTPFGSILKEINDIYPNLILNEHSNTTLDNVTFSVLPFLTQHDYDRLLWACDVNFVRGEDSWIRAIWAGKPFLWQPYIQTEDTHALKLKAFLKNYTQQAEFGVKAAIEMCSYAWSNIDQLDKSNQQNPWQQYFEQLPALQSHAIQQSNFLISQADLATKLVIFSEKIHQNQV